LARSDQSSGGEYQPLADERCLFLRFAHLEADERQLLAFATRYGFLGVSDTQPIRTGLGEPDSDILWGESFDKWTDALTIMRVAVILAGLFRIGDKTAVERAKDLVALSPIGDKHTGVRVRLGGLHGFEDIPLSMGADDSYWSRLTVVANPPTTDKAAANGLIRAALVDMVNANLRALCSPALVDSEGAVRLTVQPSNLLGAMWLQLARAIEGKREYLRCEECGDWFDVGSDSSRSDRRTCSDRCRQRKYRRRVAQRGAE